MCRSFSIILQAFICLDHVGKVQIGVKWPYCAQRYCGLFRICGVRGFLEWLSGFTLKWFHCDCIATTTYNAEILILLSDRCSSFHETFCDAMQNSLKKRFTVFCRMPAHVYNFKSALDFIHAFRWYFSAFYWCWVSAYNKYTISRLNYVKTNTLTCLIYMHSFLQKYWRAP